MSFYYDIPARVSRMIEGPDGLWYSWSPQDGMYGSGTICSMNMSDETPIPQILHHFNAENEGRPIGDFIFASDGHIWGMTLTTRIDGNRYISNYRIYRLTLSNWFEIMFTSVDVRGSAIEPGLLQAWDGYIYGFMPKLSPFNGDQDVMWRIDVNGLNYSIVYEFEHSVANNWYQAIDGNLYGTIKPFGECSYLYGLSISNLKMMRLGTAPRNKRRQCGTLSRFVADPQNPFTLLATSDLGTIFRFDLTSRQLNIVFDMELTYVPYLGDLLPGRVAGEWFGSFSPIPGCSVKYEPCGAIVQFEVSAGDVWKMIELHQFNATSSVEGSPDNSLTFIKSRNSLFGTSWQEWRFIFNLTNHHIYSTGRRRASLTGDNPVGFVSYQGVIVGLSSVIFESVVFMVDASSSVYNMGTFGTISSAPTNVRPRSGLVVGRDGYIYSATRGGSSNSSGTFFRFHVDTNNAQTVDVHVIRRVNSTIDGDLVAPMFASTIDDSIVLSSKSTNWLTNDCLIQFTPNTTHHRFDWSVLSCSRGSSNYER